MAYARLDDADEATVVSDVPLDARFPWWSFTKTAIAASALVLVSRGLLALDGPLPGRRFSLRQLLQHRAGVPNYGALPAYHAAVASGDAPWSERRLLDAVDADRLDFAPGEGWAYSNVGYLFACRLLERASGLDLGETIGTLLCEPLGLETVRLSRTPGDLETTHWGNRPAYHPGWVYHGLLVGSAPDACRLLRGVLDGPLLPAVLRREARSLFPLGRTLPGRPWTRFGYGLGLMGGTMGEAGEVWGHSGAGPHDVCAIYRFAETARPCTVAMFDESPTEHRAERAAVRIALEPRPGPTWRMSR